MILLDSDGVIADFVRAALRLHGSALTPADLTSYHLEPQMGITPTEFWRGINGAGPEFWANLEPYPWFSQLYNGLKAIDRVMIVSRPGWSWQSYAGKKMWFDRMFGERFRDICLIKDKDLLARPTRVLVDDAPQNIASFLAADGEACLFPQPWNGSPEPDAAAIDDVLQRVARKLGR